jgi:hypothetical protein
MITSTMIEPPKISILIPFLKLQIALLLRFARYKQEQPNDIDPNTTLLHSLIFTSFYYLSKKKARDPDISPNISTQVVACVFGVRHGDFDACRHFRPMSLECRLSFHVGFSTVL